MSVDGIDVTISSSLKGVEEFFRILCEIPGYINGIPAPRYTPDRYPTKDSEQIVRRIDQLWQNYTSKGPVLPLLHLCRKVIRKALSPASGYKIDVLPLPYVLKKFIKQTDIADRIYAQVIDASQDTIDYSFTVDF